MDRRTGALPPAIIRMGIRHIRLPMTWGTTAALSSLPYTPEYSMEAIRFFYETIGDKTWGSYGFYDAFNVARGWFGKSYLAIDQGPIITMIENYRSALLWNTCMSAPEVKAGLTTLKFTY